MFFCLFRLYFFYCTYLRYNCKRKFRIICDFLASKWSA